MDQIYYNQIMELKREGKYDECLKIYNEHLNDEEADATFFSGLAKIHLLKGDYMSARADLIKVFVKCFVFRLDILEKTIKNENKPEDYFSTRTIQQEITQAMKVYEVMSSMLGGDMAQKTYNDFKLNKTELMLCFCSGHDQTYYRYLFALACQNQVPYGCEEIAEKMMENKTAILNVLKGVASEEERKKDGETWNLFLSGGSRNKYAIIFGLLNDFANCLTMIKQS